MKREKPTGLRSNDKNVKPSKKLKVRITSDDRSPSEAGKSKEANNTPVYPSGRVTRAKAGGKTSEATKNISDDRSPSETGQSKEANNTPVYPSVHVTRAKVGGKTSETTKSISNGKKTPGKREKAVELKSPVIKSARKKGEISANNKGQKTLPEDIAEEGVTLLMHLSGENNRLNPEAETPQSFDPLSTEITGNQEDMEANADTTVRRETGRPDKIRRQAKLPEIPLGVSNENGDAIPAAVDALKQKNTSSTVVVNGDKTLNRGFERELALQQDTYKTVKGKQGERRSISSLETEAPAQGTKMAQVSTPRHELIQGEERGVGKSNLKVDLSKLPCHPTCQIIVEILQNHFIRRLLIASCSVPEVYLIQFWKSLEVSKDNKTIGIRLDHRDIQFKVDTLRVVLGLPAEGSRDFKKFSRPPSISELIRFLRELGYDESQQKLTNLSSINRKFIPQPWLTLYAILTNCITGKQTGHEHPSLQFLQFYWGVVNLASIDYAQLIWEDMISPARQFKGQTSKKIPFYRFTKLLIGHFMHKYSDIDRRTGDKEHRPNLDPMFTSVRIRKSNTTKQGMRIPDRLIADILRNTKVFKVYDAAQRNKSVGLSGLTTKSVSKDTEKVFPIPKSRTKKAILQPKRKLTLRDEPIEEETVKETGKKTKETKGKGIEIQEEAENPPLSESEEEEQMQLVLEESTRSGDDEPLNSDKEKEDTEASDDETVSSDERVRASDDEEDKESDDEERDDEEEQKSDDEESENEEGQKSDDKESENEEDEQKSDNEEGDNDASDKDEQNKEQESDDESIEKIGDYQNFPIPTQVQKHPAASSQSQPLPTKQTKESQLYVHPSLLRSLNKDYQQVKKQLEEQKQELEKFKVKDRLPREVRNYVLDQLLEKFVKDNLKGVVSRTLQTTPITIQALPTKPYVNDLKGKLLEAIADDPDEAELLKALIKSMKRASQEDDSCKPSKPSKRRHDDTDPDDQPPQGLDETSAPDLTTQELDETSFVTVAQMKTVMSTARAHVNEQIEKAVADQFKKYLASQPTSQPTTSSTPHPNTSGPRHNYKDFEFEELKQMMLAHMLDHPELRNAKPALFGYLYRGVDLEHTCTTNVLRKRLHDDQDSDNH